MKIKLILVGVLLLALVGAALWLRHGGVTHERIYGAVTDESAAIRERVDERYRALDGKLDRIEGKLDRLLELANRPLPDNMKSVQ